MRVRSAASFRSELENAKVIIRENREAMDALVAALLEKNRLKGDEIDAVLSAKAKR